jgi:sialate O-acetylesterase
MIWYREELKGFAIQQKDGSYQWAKAEAKGNKVMVWNDQVSNPVNVRYDWADNPDGNLKTKAGFLLHLLQQKKLI